MDKLYRFEFVIVKKADKERVGQKSVPANSLEEAAAQARREILAFEDIQLSCVTVNE